MQVDAGMWRDIAGLISRLAIPTARRTSANSAKAASPLLATDLAMRRRSANRSRQAWQFPAAPNRTQSSAEVVVWCARTEPACVRHQRSGVCGPRVWYGGRSTSVITVERMRAQQRAKYASSSPEFKARERVRDAPYHREATARRRAAARVKALVWIATAPLTTTSSSSSSSSPSASASVATVPPLAKDRQLVDEFYEPTVQLYKDAREGFRREVDLVRAQVEGGCIFLGILEQPVQVVICRYGSHPTTLLRPLQAGDRRGILNLLCNGVDPQFGCRPDGQMAYTFIVLMAAIRLSDGWQDHAITNLSHIITHWRYCPPAIVFPPIIIIIVLVIQAILSSPFHVIILYGKNVRHGFHSNLSSADGRARVGECAEYEGVRFAVLSTRSRAFWLIDSPHPSYRMREGRISAAVRLADILRCHHCPPVEQSLQHFLTSPDHEAVKKSIMKFKPVFGADEAEAEVFDEAEEEESESDEEGDAGGRMDDDAQ